MLEATVYKALGGWISGNPLIYAVAISGNPPTGKIIFACPYTSAPLPAGEEKTVKVER